jgi:hypothetical protein
VADVSRKRLVYLLDASPGRPVGYAVNLLRSAAMVEQDIRKEFRIECKLLSLQDYPAEEAESTQSRRDLALVCDLARECPDVIGLSVFVWNIGFFSRVSRLISLVMPNCRIIWGGKLVENWTDALVSRNPEVDCFCIAEGEIVFREYLKYLSTGADLEAPIPGTVMRTRGGEFQRSTELPFVRDLASLPNPYVSRAIDPRTVEWACIETLRGCIFHCTFCDWGGKNYRTFSDDYVVQVIDAVVEQRFGFIFFMDSVFAMTRSRRKRFLAHALSRCNGISKFAFEIMLEMLDEEECAMLRELVERASLAKIEIGLQSANPETLRIIKRPFQRDRFVAKYKMLVDGCPDLQDRVQMDLIVGLPSETWESYASGFNFVVSLDPGLISAYPLDVFPGSEMHAVQKSTHGLVALEGPPFSLISTPTMSASEVQRLTVISWIAASLRSVLRRSIFYLHLLTNGDVFSVFVTYQEWAIARGYLRNTFDYADIKNHSVWFFDFIIGLKGLPSIDQIHLARLWQLLLLDLAPYMVLNDCHHRFSAILRRRRSITLRGRRITCASTDTRDMVSRNLFVLDDLVLYDSYPQEAASLLDKPGSFELVYVEGDGEAYDIRFVSESQALAIAKQRPLRSIFTCKAPADVLQRDIKQKRRSDAIRRPEAHL